jgi:hypothetical protein
MRSHGDVDGVPLPGAQLAKQVWRGLPRRLCQWGGFTKEARPSQQRPVAAGTRWTAPGRTSTVRDTSAADQGELHRPDGDPSRLRTVTGRGIDPGVSSQSAPTRATDIDAKTRDVLEVRDGLGQQSSSAAPGLRSRSGTERLREAMEGRSYRDTSRPAIRTKTDADG